MARNAVVLIKQIEDERLAGCSAPDAAVEATASRFRSIALTAVSTVLGMISIMPPVFWGPMALAITGDVMGVTAPPLIFLSVLYVTWFGCAIRAGIEMTVLGQRPLRASC